MAKIRGSLAAIIRIYIQHNYEALYIAKGEFLNSV